MITPTPSHFLSMALGAFIGGAIVWMGKGGFDPEWVAALGTVCAFGVTTFSIWRDHRNRHIDQRRAVFHHAKRVTQECQNAIRAINTVLIIRIAEEKMSTNQASEIVQTKLEYALERLQAVEADMNAIPEAIAPFQSAMENLKLNICRCALERENSSTEINYSPGIKSVSNVRDIANRGDRGRSVILMVVNAVEPFTYWPQK
ncbi:MAG: hypothetical protein K9H25_02975 [Rhodospirillum sp.]|nr:hypothetical protein [Rhodospirillum sp.]MCF8488618.1 hypothetical protein [Rhodospirillum sp.]MCF8502369.1 hypothetical protein [Rhodospirillum sp.]